MLQVSASEGTTIWRDPRALALLFAASMTVMANATISPALPGLEKLFAGDPNAALLTRLLVPAPSLAVVFVAPLAGLWADRFGKRLMLLVGIFVFVAAGTAGLYLPSLPSIFASRLVLGVAVAMIMTAQTALIGDYFAAARRNAFMGLQVSARNFGGLTFITLGGWLALASPHLPFAIYALPLLFLPLIWRAVGEPVHGAAATVSQDLHATDGHAAWPLLILALAGLQMTTNMIFFMMPTQLPFFLSALGQESALMSGTALGALTLTGGCIALFYGRIKRKLAFSGTYALGYGLFGLGFACLSGAGSVWPVLLGAALVGAGYSIVTPTFVAVALDLAPARRRGIGAGILTTSVFLGQVFSVFASTPSIAAFGYDGTFCATALLLGGMAGVAGAIRALAIVRAAASADPDHGLPAEPRQ